MTTVHRLVGDLPPDSGVIGELVRLWRDAREERLRFLSDLHDADEDRAYLSRVVLPANEVWVAAVDGAAAGFVAFARGWVNHLYVAPAFQGRGVGTELLAIAMRCNPALQLWVFEANDPAIRFYARRGFRVAERTDGASNDARRPDLRLEWSR